MPYTITDYRGDTMSQVFSSARRGYDPEEVDNYIAQLQEIIDQRNHDIQKFKEREASIQKSLTEAQTVSKQIIMNAQQQAASIVFQAQQQAAAVHTASINEITQLTLRIQALRHKLDEFKLAYEHIIEQYLISAKAIEMTALFNDLDATLKGLGVTAPDEPAADLDSIKPL